MVVSIDEFMDGQATAFGGAGELPVSGGQAGAAEGLCGGEVDGVQGGERQIDLADQPGGMRDDVGIEGLDAPDAAASMSRPSRSRLRSR